MTFGFVFGVKHYKDLFRVKNKKKYPSHIFPASIIL
jgi:hypothetical protein